VVAKPGRPIFFIRIIGLDGVANPGQANFFLISCQAGCQTWQFRQFFGLPKSGLAGLSIPIEPDLGNPENYPSLAWPGLAPPVDLESGSPEPPKLHKAISPITQKYSTCIHSEIFNLYTLILLGLEPPKLYKAISPLSQKCSTGIN